MHLASIVVDGAEQVAFRLPDGRVAPVSAAARAAGPTHAALASLHRMEHLIEGGDALRFGLERLVAQATARPESVPSFDATELRWLPPVPRPGKVIGIPLNNRAADERKLSAPAHPLFFLKPPGCLLGHREPIVIRPYYGSVHPEPELAVIIGRRARDVDPREALGYVYGYTILNDLTGVTMRAEDRVHYYALYPSAKDPDQLERREQQNSYTARYKGTDGFGPCGPWLVTRDAVADPAALDVRCTVGGEVVAEDSTAFYTFRVEEVIAYVSRFQALLPGDIISMGTAFRPGQDAKRSLHVADLQRLDGPVEVTITGLGTLSNPVRRENPALPLWRLPPA
jgi:2-keto-4-pentenoate hydratase/2-oxohepta-3-ene-1,7-dioic acid hydratase in catechol pathway